MQKNYNCNLIKDLTEKELLGILPKYKFKLKPYNYQLPAIVGCVAFPGFLVCLDIGLGKTKVAIDSLSICYPKFDIKVLVVCSRAAKSNWGEEILKNRPEWDIHIFDGSKEEKYDILLKSKNTPGFYIINYESLRFLLCEKKKKKLKMSDKLFRKAKFDALIIDESHKIKNIHSLNFKMIRRLTKETDKRILLTGTPIGKNLLDIWAQYFVIDRGETFQTSYTLFKEAYFENKARMSKGFFYSNWQVTESGGMKIGEKLFNKAIRVAAEEVDELPDKIYYKKKFSLTEKQKADYDLAARKLISTNIGLKELGNKDMNLRQICSGFMYKKGKTYKYNPKLELFVDILKDSIDTTKIVVFAEFIKEADLILEEARKLKIKVSQLRGGIKDPGNQVKKFNTDDNYRLMIAHPLSGGDSINLISATVCIFFSNGYDKIQRQQAEKRIHRRGQENTCFYYDLVGEETIENSIYKMLIEGIQYNKSFIRKNSLSDFLKGKIRG